MRVSDLIACTLLGLISAAASMGMIWIVDAITAVTGWHPFWAFTVLYTVVLLAIVLED